MFKKILLGFLAAVVAGAWMACIAADENVWLHVDGRYIKTADGKIFIPAGAAYIASDTINGNPEDILSWCKKLKMSAIRITFREEIAYKDIDSYLIKYVDPIVQACRLYGIYAFIDAHNYFHEFKEGDGFLPTAGIWGKERVQQWADNWKKIADRYKDEPWVLGYELLNEPYDISAGKTRDFYLQAIKAVREVDKKHIIILGTCQFSHVENMEETWSKLKFMPDAPYNQVVFSFHEYTKAHDPAEFAPVLDEILKKYNIPILCTEFGSDAVIDGVSLEERRKFETDMFATLKQRQIGWTIWMMKGTYPQINCEFEDIWQPALAEQASVTSIVMKGNLECTSSAKSAVADGKPSITITAAIKDFDGKPIATADDMIKFVVKGAGSLDGENPVKAKEGVATIKLKFNKTGVVKVLATASGLYNGGVDVIGKFDKAAKVVCKAEPASIPADGASKAKVYACIADMYGNTVESGPSYRVNCEGPEYVDSKGQLWLGDQTYSEGSWGYTIVGPINTEKKDYKFAKTDDDVLFYSRRPLSEDTGYRFTIPNGKYKVEMFFAETWYGVNNESTKGARVFDIVMENEAKIKNLDIFDKAGAKTVYSEVCSVEVKDGVLDLFANNKVDRAEIRAISITPETPATDKVTFSVAGAGSLEGINPADSVGGIAVINLKSGTAVGTARITAAYPGLTAGSVDVTVGK